MRTDLLIAEADTTLRDAYESLFGKLGIQVETAADGLECWKTLQRRNPDVLVLDMDMPWGGGEGVLARLKEDCEESLNPAIFLTGVDSPQVLSSRYGIAVGSCFQKPFRPSELLESVCAVIDAASATPHTANLA